MILRLPEGYKTRIGERGACSQAGSAAHGLARAVYGDPFLVCWTSQCEPRCPTAKTVWRRPSTRAQAWQRLCIVVSLGQAA